MEQGLIIDQFDELRALYSGLTLEKTDGVWNIQGRSEERRVGTECRSRCSQYH